VSAVLTPPGVLQDPLDEKVTVVMALPLGDEGGAHSLRRLLQQTGIRFTLLTAIHNRRLIAIPLAANWNVLVFAMVIGCPVHDPNRYRVASVLSQISIPTIDQLPPDPV
jgi:hypothetical protein